MTQNQKEIIAALRELMEPQLEHLRNLEKLCEDPRKKVARDFYFYYKAEYANYEHLMQMLIAEFNGGNADE